MVTFIKDGEMLQLTYSAENENEDWISEKFEEDKEEDVRIKRAFYFWKKDLLRIEKRNNEFDPSVYYFELGHLEGDYYKIPPGRIMRRKAVYLHRDIDLQLRYFVADSTINIFRTLEELVDEDIYVDGEQASAIPLEAFEQLIDDFPTPYEKKMYAEARITAILKNYLETAKDGETKYQRYMNKRSSRSNADLGRMFKDSEILKYSTLYDQLEQMLTDEQDYSEKVWQNEIMQVIRLLYPKYVAVLSNVPISDREIGDRILDFLLVDSSGHVDIIEIKKPFGQSIITQGKFRNNYIPLRELSGTIMQLEKYIFFLNRWGTRGEDHLTKTWSLQLPEKLQIKITNPNGIIIMGRDNKLSHEQKLDFEVVKRKYKNVADIMTYDNLLERLKITIEQLRKL